MASAGVAVLTTDGHDNRTYEISVSESLSFYDVATILSELSGKQIQYAAPDVATFTAAMKQAGVPDEGKVAWQKPLSMRDFLRQSYTLS
jgi:NAD(P)H dehydrogenase (quinone)